MEKHTKEQTVVEFEAAAEQLTSLLFAQCEQRLADIETLPSPTNAAFAASALAVQEAIKTFLAVMRIQ